MFTKEELLEKGVSPEVADEIIANFEDDSDDALSSLQKALDGDSEPNESLFKAEDEEEKKEEEDEEKEEKGDKKEFMKKMKKYMKDNPAQCKKMMKEVGAMTEKMSKAVEDVDDSDGILVEYSDGKEVFEAISSSISALSKAVEAVNERIDVLVTNSDRSYDVLVKEGRVLSEMAKATDLELSKTTGRKSASIADQKMVKAIDFPDGSPKVIHETLMKAIHNGDRNAGQIISSFEANGHDPKKLLPEQRMYINQLINSEAK